MKGKKEGKKKAEKGRIIFFKTNYLLATRDNFRFIDRNSLKLKG